MDELIQRITAKVGLSEEQATSAMRIILNFLHTEGPREKVEALAGQMGASDYLAAAPAKGGLFGRIGGMIPGGGAMAAFGALTQAGLDLSQVQDVVKIFIRFAKEKAGAEAVDEVVAEIPGLAKLF